jgi:hypothetical protein
MIEPIEERLAKCPVAAVYEVMDAIQEIRRLRAEIEAMRINEEVSDACLENWRRQDCITQCPSCGWRSNG